MNIESWDYNCTSILNTNKKISDRHQFFVWQLKNQRNEIISLLSSRTDRIKLDRCEDYIFNM